MQLKAITAIAVLLVVVVLVSISGCTSSNNPATATPTPAASNVPTATPTVTPTATATPTPTAKPTAAPTSVPISVLLAEQPASASGPDLSAQINANMSASGLTFHRVTIDGHDAYAAHSESRGMTDGYAFPCSSYSEAQALQANYVNVFKTNGFAVSDVSQDPWGPNSILTALNNGKISISAGTETNTVPSIIGIGPEVDILIGS